MPRSIHALIVQHDVQGAGSETGLYCACQERWSAGKQVALGQVREGVPPQRRTLQRVVFAMPDVSYTLHAAELVHEDVRRQPLPSRLDSIARQVVDDAPGEGGCAVRVEASRGKTVSWMSI